MGIVLTVAGVLFQVVGGVVAFRGLIKTHDAYADKSIRTLADERVERLRGNVGRAVNRLLRRPQNIIIAVGGATLGVGALRARAIVGFGPLPKRTADALAEIDRRLRQLGSRIDAVDERAADALGAQAAAMEQLHADIEKATKDATEAVRSAAIEGLMGEAVGLMLVIVGGVLQAFGALIPTG
jgi:hypothetical protein